MTTAPKFTVHWTSALTGTCKSSACATKTAGIAECKALYKEGAKNVRLTEFKQGIGSTDINWRIALRNAA